MRPPSDSSHPIDERDRSSPSREGSKVQFVGAGPGPADLLTVRAAAAIASADVVVYDQLVHRDVLDQVPRSARLVPVSRETAAGDAVDAGQATGLMLAELAAGGGRVVRLKGGDPTIFARLAEEMRPLLAAGIPIEIVPGVTAATAAAAAAGIPLTSRSSASAVTFVTGHQAGSNADGVDLGKLAMLSGTLAFYMGVERIQEWTSRLIAEGCALDTPVAIVSRCGWPDQRIVFTSLAGASRAAAREEAASPAVAIVGAVVGEGRTGHGADGGERMTHAPPPRPLEGVRVLLVRASGQSGEMAEMLEARGAECVEAPAIRIGPPESWVAVDDAIDRAWSFDWIVFSSANGVRAFVGRLRSRRLDPRTLGAARLAAVGPRTAEELGASGLECDLVPDGPFEAESLAKSLLHGPAGRRFLLVRADRGRDLLAEQLAAAGHHVTEVVAYTSRDVESVDPEVLAELHRRPADWIVLTSSAVARSAARLFPEQFSRIRIASISPRTSEAIREVGGLPTVEADVPTTASLVEAICRHEASRANRTVTSGT